MSTANYSEYVVILPDGSEHFRDKVPKIWVILGSNEPDWKELCNEVVRSAKLTTSRKAPQTIEVQVFGLKTEKGVVKRQSIGKYKVQPPLAAMTDEELDEEINDAVSGLPEEFQSYVRSKSWEDGHSAGREEVASLAGGLARELYRVVHEYNKRLGINLKEGGRKS